MNIRYSAEAVLFFKDNSIAKEMTYSEFQAILDAYVPLDDLAKQKMNSVYLRINSDLKVVAAVFFTIQFDKQGFADKHWDIPLEQLADSTADGPDLGAGAIKLTCYSQCNIEWHQKNLWDPQQGANGVEFKLITQSIQENKLGFVFTAEEESHAAPVSYNTSAATNDDRQGLKEVRQHAALIIKEQRMKTKLLMAQAEQDKRQIRLDHQEHLLNYQAELAKLERDIETLRAEKNTLEEELGGLKEKNSGMREYYENKLLSAQQSSGGEDLEALKQYYETEAVLQVEAAIKEQESALNTRDVEILYRKEREDQLQQQVLSLQKENSQLLQSGGNENVLDQLAESGVSFVVYHPGAGNLVIPKNNVKRYLGDTLSYVAGECGVDEKLYREWLNHFYTPVCQHQSENGALCNKDLLRIEEPGLYIAGESDRCALHQTSNRKIVSIGKKGL